jgi:hypothetical protein
MSITYQLIGLPAGSARDGHAISGVARIIDAPHTSTLEPAE